MNRVVLRDALSGNGYWAAVEMMDSDDALRGLRSVWLHWYMKPSIIDVLHVFGVQEASRRNVGLEKKASTTIEAGLLIRVLLPLIQPITPLLQQP